MDKEVEDRRKSTEKESVKSLEMIIHIISRAYKSKLKKMLRKIRGYNQGVNF